MADRADGELIGKWSAARTAEAVARSEHSTTQEALNRSCNALGQHLDPGDMQAGERLCFRIDGETIEITKFTSVYGQYKAKLLGVRGRKR